MPKLKFATEVEINAVHLIHQKVYTHHKIESKKEICIHMHESYKTLQAR